MKKTIACGALLLLGSSLVGACDDGTQTLAKPQIEALIGSLCDMSFECCDEGEAAYFLGPYVLEGDCTQRMVDAASYVSVTPVDLGSIAGLRDGLLVIPNLPALDQAVEDGRVEIDEEQVEKCQAYLEKEGCNQPPEEDESDPDVCTPPEPPNDETPCDMEKLFIGQLEEGEICTSGTFSFECAPGFACGTGAGLGTDGRCVEQREEGETCDSSQECLSGLYCSPLDNTCQERRDVDEVCVFADRNNPSPDPQTLLVECKSHLSCDPVSNTCVEACQRGAQCSDDTQCAEDLSCVLGRCSELREEGQPCEVTENCSEGLRCAANPQKPGELSCQTGLPTGSPCANDIDCESGFCDSNVAQCAAQVAAGSPCPSGRSAECDGGACVQESPGTVCSTAGDCPNSGTCDVFGQCGTYCIALKTEGASCTDDLECESESCIAGSCADPPLLLGEECDMAEDCESEFCNYESPRVCEELPLDLGDPCLSPMECDSLVCFEGECDRGLEEGQECDDPTEPPCDPKTTYCDTIDQDPPICVELRETGEDCESALQCRGGCILRHNRMLCSPAPKEDAAICDGGGSSSSSGAGGSSGN